MHGVAFNAQIISAENGDPGPEDGIVLGNDGAVYQAGWNKLVASGARIINNSWGIGITEKFDKGGYDPAYPHFTVNDAQKQFDQIKQILGTKPAAPIRARSTRRAAAWSPSSPPVTITT